MEDHKELFYMKLLEYEENLPKHTGHKTEDLY
jgi:hypothetical protein